MTAVAVTRLAVAARQVHAPGHLWPRVSFCTPPARVVEQRPRRLAHGVAALALDPASGLRQRGSSPTLGHATVVVDHFHANALANAGVSKGSRGWLNYMRLN